MVRTCDVLQVLFGPGMEGRYAFCPVQQLEMYVECKTTLPKLAMAAAGITLSISQLGFPQGKFIQPLNLQSMICEDFH